MGLLPSINRLTWKDQATHFLIMFHIIFLSTFFQWFLYVFIGWLNPWLWPLVTLYFVCFYRSPICLILFLSVFLQWFLYVSIGWLNPWLWPLVTLYFVCFYRFRSAFFLFLFYFLHYYASFDGPNRGACFSIIESRDATVLWTQDIYNDHLFGSDSGIDKILLSYRSWGALIKDDEVYSFGQIGDSFFYRPRLEKGKNQGEMVLFLSSYHYFTFHSDQTYTEIRNGTSERRPLNLWKDTSGKELIKSFKNNQIENYKKNWGIENPNYLYSFLIWFVYPIFFITYWNWKYLRLHFENLGYANFFHTILIVAFYIPFGSPDPALWPLIIVIQGWLLNLKVTDNEFLFKLHLALFGIVMFFSFGTMIATDRFPSPVFYCFAFLLSVFMKAYQMPITLVKNGGDNHY